MKADNTICIHGNQNYRISVVYMEKLLRDEENPLKGLVDYLRRSVKALSIAPDEKKGNVRINLGWCNEDHDKYFVLELRKILSDPKNEVCQLASNFYERSDGTIHSKATDEEVPFLTSKEQWLLMFKSMGNKV